MTRPETTRVVVCGAGMAGLTAAVSAAEAGASVLVLEKGPEIGGSTALSGGLVWTCEDLGTYERLVPGGDPLLHQLVHSELADGRRWLEELGVEFTPVESVYDYGLGQRMDPPQALELLATRLEELDGEIRLQTGLSRLLADQGAVVGLVTVNAEGASEVLPADAVVLATGGFQGNPDLVGRWITSPDNLYLRASGWSTGDGLIAAGEIGAALTPGLDQFYGHALAGPPAHFHTLEFREASHIYGMKAVALNLLGHRFVDESAGSGEEELNAALAGQPEGRGFYIVDAATAQAESRPGRRSPRVIMDWTQEHGGVVVEAESLAGLAEGLAEHGLPRSTTLETLEEFNKCCLEGRTADLSPPRQRDATPLVTPPFFASSVKASITFTEGGLAVDTSCRVLRRCLGSSPLAQSTTRLEEYRAAPMPGLFAVGSDVGNVSHGGYVGGLATAITTGRKAGRIAARSRSGTSLAEVTT